MKTRIILIMLIAAMATVIGCGGSGSNQSSQLSFDMVLLQVDGEPPVDGEPVVYGTVFNDLNGDGVMDSVEPGIEGVTLTLGNGYAEFLTGTVTDQNGQYAFAVSVDSSYTVEETDPDGYYSTLNGAPVNVSVAGSSVQVDFGDRMIPEVPVDVKPGSDINPLNLRSKGVLPVAILGAENFDVTMIDPSTLLFNGVSPLRWSYEDVCGSDDPGMDGNDAESPDGFEDLTLKFSTQEIAASLGEGLKRGDVVTLIMDGYLMDGTPISGQETVWIVQVPK